MNKFVKFTSVLAVVAVAFMSCEKDEGKKPNISFKNGAGYTYTDATLATSAAFKIGINASKSEDKDVLKKFFISRQIDGGTTQTVYEKDLSGAEGDNYEYDYSDTVDTDLGQVNQYTFTVTNRDGITNQVSLKVNKQ